MTNTITRDDVIRMAREAGFGRNPFSEVLVRNSKGAWVDVLDLVERFAALVAAAEREECAKVAEATVTCLPHTGAFLSERCAAAIRDRAITE